MRQFIRGGDEAFAVRRLGELTKRPDRSRDSRRDARHRCFCYTHAGSGPFSAGTAALRGLIASTVTVDGGSCVMIIGHGEG